MDRRNSALSEAVVRHFNQGSIEVESRPSDAAVALDGAIVGRTPLSIPNVAEGTHVVGIELPGFSRWATSVQVNRGEQARVGASLSPIAP